MGINTFERAKPYIAGWTDQFKAVDGAPEQQQAAIMNDVSTSMEKSQDQAQKQSQGQAQPVQRDSKPVAAKQAVQAAMGR
jgi:hypothetical protein